MVRRWVVNASPIISLTKIDRIHLLQQRLAEIDNGTVQAIPGEIALAQIRQLIEP